MLLPNRNGSAGSYRYGFQGQEKDDEVKGEGNSINYKYRMHDPRVGRFFAVDPLATKYPWYSPYQFGGNSTIRFIELEGLEQGDYYVKEFVNECGETHIETVDFVDNGDKVNQFKFVPNRLFVLDPDADANTPYRKEYNGQYYQMQFIGYSADFYGDDLIKNSQYKISNDSYAHYEDDAQEYIWNGGDYSDSNWLQRLQEVNTKSGLYSDMSGLLTPISAGPIRGFSSSPKVPATEVAPIPKKSGSGPVAGVLEVSPNVKSIAQFKNYNPKNATEFVFDYKTNTFVVGQVKSPTAGLSPHQNLVKSINASEKSAVGGMFKRGPNGEIQTNEMSGHLHQNWTPEIRSKFQNYLSSQTKQTVIHSEGPTF